MPHELYTHWHFSTYRCSQVASNFTLVIVWISSRVLQFFSAQEHESKSPLIVSCECHTTRSVPSRSKLSKHAQFAWQRQLSQLLKTTE